MSWIKVDVDTPRKDAILDIMEMCHCSNGDAFLAWFNLYAWFDASTADGTLNATPDEIDRRAGLPGVAEALVRAGWIAFRGRVCVVVNWLEHNGRSAKARAQHAALVARRRVEKATFQHGGTPYHESVPQ